jgi:hypothetical protein
MVFTCLFGQNASSTLKIKAVKALPFLLTKNNSEFQPVKINADLQVDSCSAVVSIEGNKPVTLHFRKGENNVEVPVKAVSSEKKSTVKIESGGILLYKGVINLRPVRKLTCYIVPMSHTDIGYTEIQTAIEDKQVQNLVKGIELAKKTANYPEGAKFIWNVEVSWAADLYLKRLNDVQKKEFLDAVKRGDVSLNGMYLNLLTGLSRPEELSRLFKFSTGLAQKTNVPITSAMTSDVPGQTWGTVTALSQAGIRYFSSAPNYFDRIGDILAKWENKAFYWASPTGKEKVLVWVPYKGYALSHIIRKFTIPFAETFVNLLDSTKYPYDIIYVRWSGHGDNAVPDGEISEFVKDWVPRYTWPKFVISSCSNAFESFEKRYGSRLPVVKGDWTPYWEDGAGSSAL